MINQAQMFVLLLLILFDVPRKLRVQMIGSVKRTTVGKVSYRFVYKQYLYTKSYGFGEIKIFDFLIIFDVFCFSKTVLPNLSLESALVKDNNCFSYRFLKVIAFFSENYLLYSEFSAFNQNNRL